MKCASKGNKDIQLSLSVEITGVDAEGRMQVDTNQTALLKVMESQYHGC